MKGCAKGHDVAVKTTRAGVDKIYLKALIQELKMLVYLGSHENIVNICGAHTSELRQGSANF